MKGASEFAKLFTTGQHDRLYLVSSSHARGKTFHIYVLPEGVAAKSNGSGNAPLNADAVEVYGVVDGNPGWTESYGWKHKGPWQQDFEAMVKRRNDELEHAELQRTRHADQKQQAEIERVAALLATYKTAA